MQKNKGIENYNFPNEAGKFGEFGGTFVPEVVMSAVNELKEAYPRISRTKEFQEDLASIMKNYAGRPTALTYVPRLSKKYGFKIYLKREDLLYGGAHKLNNTMGQALLAKYLGKTKLIAETGAGQHGFASAIAAAYFGMELKVFMGEEDIKRQRHNVYRIQLLNGKIVPVSSGSKTLKDATNEAIRYWASNFEDTHYLIGSVIGPHPYPMMVRDFQSIIGREIKKQIREAEGRDPSAIVACVGGGSNAIGAFYDFIKDDVDLYAVEAAGEGADTDKNSIALGIDTKGILHGSLMYLMQDDHGNVKDTHSICAGLDYPGVGPEHCLLKSLGRIKLGSSTDDECMAAFKELCLLEGIIPALESSHALAFLEKIKKLGIYGQNDVVVVNLSGSGSKDLDIVRERVHFDI